MVLPAAWSGPSPLPRFRPCPERDDGGPSQPPTLHLPCGQHRRRSRGERAFWGRWGGCASPWPAGQPTGAAVAGGPEGSWNPNSATCCVTLVKLVDLPELRVPHRCNDEHINSIFLKVEVVHGKRLVRGLGQTVTVSQHSGYQSYCPSWHSSGHRTPSSLVPPYPPPPE